MKRLLSKVTLALIVILGTLLGSVIPLKAASPPNISSLQSPFTVDPNQKGYSLPSGSTINQYDDGTTIVTDPDGQAIFQTSDAKSSFMPSSNGQVLTNHFYLVPSGSDVYPEVDSTRIFYNQSLILTIKQNKGAAPIIPSLAPLDLITQQLKQNNVGAPTVVTNAASKVGWCYATANADLSNLGTASSVTVSFQYSTTASYTNYSTVVGSPATMTSPGNFIGILGTSPNPLSPSTVYHYRAVVNYGASSPVYGNDQIFTTPFGGFTESAGAQFPQSSTITYFSAQWNVPSLPALNENQDNINFLWDGLQYQVSPTQAELIQPVLQFNQVGCFDKWTGAATYIPAQGQMVQGTPVAQASPGDQCEGYMYSAQYQGDSGFFCTFKDITEYNNSIPNSFSSLWVKGFPQNGLLSIVALEGYSIRTDSDICQDCTFSNITFLPSQPINWSPSYGWAAPVYYGQAPLSGLAVVGASLNSTQITLRTTPINSIEVSTSAATNIGSTTATLNGNLTGMGSAGSVKPYFEYGLTNNYEISNYGLSPAAASPFPLNSAGSFGATLTGLTPNTTYHYRAIAVGNGTVYGPDQTFTTALRISGSTTVFPIVASCLGVSGQGGIGTNGPFQSTSAGSGFVADVEQGGSDVGIADCIDGSSDVGMISRPLTSSESTELNSYAIARDAVCIIVNNHVPSCVTQLTEQQIRGIYEGVYKLASNGDGINEYWDASAITVSGQGIQGSDGNYYDAGLTFPALPGYGVFGAHVMIAPYAMNLTSGTRDFLGGSSATNGCGFASSSTKLSTDPTNGLYYASDYPLEQAFIGSDGSPNRVNSTSNMRNTINNANNAAIGYVGLNFSNTSGTNVRVVPIVNIIQYVAYLPTQINVDSGQYPLYRGLYLVTLKTNPNPPMSFINWMTIYNDSNGTAVIGQNFVASTGFFRLVPDEDINADGIINISDFGGLGNNWGQSGIPHFTRSDINRDGVVDISDVGDLGNWWGVTIVPLP